MYSSFTRNTSFGKLYVLLTTFCVKGKNYRVTCSLKYEDLHLPIFATNNCLEIISFVFFCGIVIIIHVWPIYFLISYLRYNTVTRWEYTSLFYGNDLYYHIIYEIYLNKCIVFTLDTPFTPF